MKYLRFFVFSMLLAATALFTWSISAFAQDAVISTQDYVILLIQSLGGLKGLSTLAIVGVVIQLIVKFLNSEICNQVFKNFTGFGKLVTISVMTLVSGVISLMVNDHLPFLAAFLHSSTLTAFMVLANQFLQQYQKTKA